MKYMLLTLLFLSSGSLLAQKGQALPPNYLMGQVFPDSVMQMQLQNMEGETVSFESILELHADKKVMIDIWASWCRDCIISLPDLNSLMFNTKDDKVDYVFISVDKEEGKWRNAIDNHTIIGDHYRVLTGWKTPLSNYIVLDWIPRYMVVDEEGLVILPKTVKANDSNMKSLLTGK